MADQDGAGDDLPGTSVFDGARSRQGYRLNKFAMSLASPEGRARFLADEAGTMRGMGLSEAEIAAVGRRDWAAMIAAGGNLYVLLKIAGTVGQNLLQMGSQMRGETLAQFMALRPGAGGH